MPEYLSPGVYVEEFELGPRPIEGVSTSTAGFLGVTLRGPLKPRLVTGFEQFKRIYGGYLPTNQSYLAYAVAGFFNNGGQRCFVGRIVGDNAATTLGPFDPVVIQAAGPGLWGNRIAFKIEDASLQDPTLPRTLFKLTVMYWDVLPPTNPPIDPDDRTNLTSADRREPISREDYDNLNADPDSVDYFQTRVNRNSNLIKITPLDPANPAVPANQALGFIGTNGVDGATPTNTHYQGVILPQEPGEETVEKSGLLGFEQIDEISILCAPDHHVVPSLTAELIIHCTQQRDRFAVLHSNPATDTLNNAENIRVPQDTTFSAFYFPWIKIFNPTTNRESLIPPSGHIAGIYAKTDIERGVFKAPANVVVSGATGLQFQIIKRQQDLLNPRGVNCIRSFPARGIRVWGARTSSTNTLWKYINVRRYFLYLAESIDEGTQWVVFEPNDERLWARVKQTITQFLTTEWRSGALMGTKAEEAFFVKVDRTTMTQNDIDNGRLICIIGVAPVKPAEFVIFRITQFSGSSEIAEL